MATEAQLPSSASPATVATPSPSASSPSPAEPPPSLPDSCHAVALLPPLPPPPFPSLPHVFALLVYNVSKRANVGSLVRSAVAFSCAAVVVVGARRLSLHGNQLTARHVPFFHYPDIRSACAHLRLQGFELVGIEIGEGAQEVSRCAFGARTCLVPGNEGSGLNAAVRPLLDRLVYVRQSGVGTASLNVATATAIVMYALQMQAAYPEQRTEGHKFHVTPPDTTAAGQQPRGAFKAPRLRLRPPLAEGGEREEGERRTAGLQAEAGVETETEMRAVAFPDAAAAHSGGGGVER